MRVNLFQHSMLVREALLNCNALTCMRQESGALPPMQMSLPCAHVTAIELDCRREKPTDLLSALDGLSLRQDTVR